MRWREWLRSFRHIESFAKRLDARLNLPRPVNEQYLSSYKTFLRLLHEFSAAFVCLGATVLSLYLLLDTHRSLASVVPEGRGVIFLFLGGLAVLLTGLDIVRLNLPYRRLFQRETFGSAHWASVSDLQAAKLLTPNNQNCLPDAIPIAPFGWKHYISLPLALLAEHIAVFGPPGCGKSASFFISLARSFSHVGGLLALDVKGEIYRYSARYYCQVFRFDLLKVECSDWFDVLGGCRGNPTRAGQVASYIVGYDANAPSGENPFWPKAATLLAQALILHLCEVADHPTPADIFTFLTENPSQAVRTTGEGKPEVYNKLAEVMAASPSRDAREKWGAAFSQLDNRTMSNVAVTFLAMLAPFADPKVRAACTRPTPTEARRGRRRIDFRALREQGTAIYVVAPEGEAARLETVVATFFAIAADELRVTGDEPNAAYTLILLDEAGNVPLRGLSEGVGVGRGRKMIYALGWQNLLQPQRQYGRETALAILGSVGTKLILPGCTGETAEWAIALLGQTTALQRQSRDAVGAAWDSETLMETGRNLMDVAELRQMERYTQALAVLQNAPPARIAFPPNAKELDAQAAEPLEYADALEAHCQPVAFLAPPPAMRAVSINAEPETAAANEDDEDIGLLANAFGTLPEDEDYPDENVF